MANITKEQLLKMHKANAPHDLVVSMEGLAERLHDYIDINRDPSAIYSTELNPIVTEIAMESVTDSLNKFQYEDGAQIFMESLTEDETEVSTPMEMTQAHEHNLRALMENSATVYRTAHPNQRNLNELTPFDAFLPFTIIRSYLPLVAKDVVPYVVPKQPFIRIKQQYKYIVTKDNKKYLRPDIYSDVDKTLDILETARGNMVIQDWLPAGTEAESDPDYEIDGQGYKMPTDKLTITGFDLLGESGGVRSVGDALDIDIQVQGARGMVTNQAGVSTMVEVTGLEAYPDLTSISPQRSISFKVKYPVKNAAGQVESYVEDTVFGEYNNADYTINLVSLTGATKQIQFGGHMSNKNNTEYISYTNEFGVYQHPIREGFRSNVPITVEDLQLYNETASIDIIANAINEITEMFTELEDSSVFAELNKKFAKWDGVEAHPFEHFQKGPVVFNKTVDVNYDNNKVLKRNEWVQDAIQFALARFIGDVRTTCQNEPFRVVLYAHPNICSLFVGDNIDWKIQPGTSVAEGIRTDYNMGIYTANGDVMRLVSSMKFKESDGIRFIVLPVNEQNFLSWKHFKYSLYFDRDHRIAEMPNNPNILGISRFQTQSYVPLQGKLEIVNYK